MDINVKRGDIYYADLSPVVGSEQGGVRPLPRWLMALLNGLVNLLRSVPFLILMNQILTLLLRLMTCLLHHQIQLKRLCLK